jgi:hypothetical protein
VLVGAIKSREGSLYQALKTPGMEIARRFNEAPTHFWILTTT